MKKPSRREFVGGVVGLAVVLNPVLPIEAAPPIQPKETENPKGLPVIEFDVVEGCLGKWISNHEEIFKDVPWVKYTTSWFRGPEPNDKVLGKSS